MAAGGARGLFCVLLQVLQQIVGRAKAVIAGDHGGFFVFHPTVVEIAAAVGIKISPNRWQTLVLAEDL